MKKVYYLLLSCVLIVLCTCTGHQYPPILMQADSLCNVNPDSAVILLKDISRDTSTMSEEARMYHRLLCIQASDKADKMKHDNEKKNIDIIVNYYEKHGDKNKLTIAYYYAGRVYAELQEAPQALDYLKKADKTLKRDDNPDLRSRIYSQTGYLFLYQEIYDEALKMFLSAYQCNKKTNDTIAIIYDLRDISTAYEAKNKHDKALEYLENAHKLALIYKNKYLIANTEHYLASLYNILEKPDSAMKYARTSLQNISMLDSSATYSLIADIYKSRKNEDSLLYYCKKIEHTGNVYAKEFAYENLTEIYLNRRNHTEAKRCFKMQRIYADSVKAIKRTDVIARMNAIYNYQEKEKENILLKEKNKRNGIIIVFSSAIAMILLVGLILYIRYSIKKRNEQLLHYKQSKRALNERIGKNKQTITKLENRLDDTSKENTELRKELEQEKERLISPDFFAAVGMKHDDVPETVMNSPVYRKFHRMSDKSSHIKPSKEDWDALEKLLNREYDNFSDKLNSLYKLSEIEYHVSMLIKLNYKPSRIAELVCCSQSNISTIRSRLYIKVFGEKSETTDWDEIIHSL